VLAGYTAANETLDPGGVRLVHAGSVWRGRRLPHAEDRPFEAIDFNVLYGKPAEVVTDDWLKFVTDLPDDTTTARNVLQSMRGRR
jgi:hypothetical protein